MALDWTREKALRFQEGGRSFAPERRATFVSAKVAKTMLAVAWPFGCPARFTGPGGGQTRCARTLPAFFPVSVALLGHATRPGEPREEL
ncbi:hypothetical protein [Nitrospira sp.]|uniref:hypothetical protein n=1 Tax=Nitrospira sp. TaxID=70125 RepID=UPI003FCD1E5D